LVAPVTKKGNLSSMPLQNLKVKTKIQEAAGSIKNYQKFI
jgi:hypothetical protein